MKKEKSESWKKESAALQTHTLTLMLRNGDKSENILKEAPHRTPTALSLCGFGHEDDEDEESSRLTVSAHVSIHLLPLIRGQAAVAADLSGRKMDGWTIKVTFP